MGNLIRELGLAILTNQRLPYDEEPSESDSDSSDSSDGRNNAHSTTELEQILKDIQGSVSYLYELAIIVRNPVPIDKFRKISENDNKSEYVTWDIQHVRDKFPKLERTSPFLIQRLGKANTRRRQFFEYNERHNSKLRHGIDNYTSQVGLETLVAEADRDDQLEDLSRKSHSEGFPDRNELVRRAPPSTSAPTLGTQTTVSTFKEADLQDDFDENDFDDGPSETSSAASESHIDEGGLEVPDAPADALEGKAFECPYCYEVIKAPSTAKWR